MCLNKLILSVLVVTSVFILGSFNTAYAVTISDGADAVGLIGQYQNLTDDPLVPDYTAKNIGGGKLGTIGLTSPSGVVVDDVNKRLFVSDGGNNRILVFNLNNDLTLQDRVADYVLGQPNFTSNNFGTAQNRLYTPQRITYASTTNYLYVVDSQNNRVVVYDVAAITNGEDAIYVLGQADFTTRTTGTSASTMNSPQGVFVDEVGGRLFVAETSNFRVLIFDISSITNGEAAVNVLGQTDFNSAVFATTQVGMSNPVALYYEYARNFLYVANGQRVTVYDMATTTDGEPAIYVLGQSNFTSNGQSTGIANFIGAATAITYDPVRQYMFVSNGNRVSVFDISTITTGESAINVLGAPGFGGSSGDLGVSSSTVYFSYGLDYASSTLYVSSILYNRISVFDVASISDGEGAVDIIGQYTNHDTNNLVVDFNKKGPDNGQVGKYDFNNPSGIVIDKVRHRLFISDSLSNRVLVFNLNNNNTLTNFEADNVLGQPNFASSTASTTQTGLRQPIELAYDEINDRLFVADSQNNRVIIYDTSSIVDGEPAVAVLGQAGFTTSSGVTTQAGMASPYSIAYSTTTGILYVGQEQSRRVTTYNIGDGITNGENAVAVLGQANFTSNQSSIVGASTTAGVMSVSLDNTNSRLFVSDYSKNRVLVFDVSSISNGEDAVSVLGQVNFTTSTTTATQGGLNSPRGLDYDESSNRLFVSDYNNARVVMYNVATTTNGEKVINVLGQSNFTTWINSQISYPTTQSSLTRAMHVQYDSDNELLYVSQGSGAGNRISIFNAGPDITAPTLSSATTSTNGTSIYITYNEPLDENSLPTTTDFIISINGATSSPSTVSISGTTVTLTIPTTIYSSDTVIITYTAGTYPVTDYSGNLAPNISSSGVTNLSSQTISTPTPTVSSGGGGGGGGGSRITTTPVTTPVSGVLPPATANAIIFTRDLTLNAQGTDVYALQRFLNARGHTVSSTGAGSPGKESSIFGSLTRQALIRFQTSVGITPATGYFGPLTRAFINKLGATPPPPATVQTPPTTTSIPTIYTRDLTLGSKGSDVTALQTYLIQKEYLQPGYATGFFGTLTQSALIKFQQANDIVPALGYFGPKTREVVGR